MPRRFLSSLFQRKTLLATSDSQDEFKVVLTDYYNTLAATGAYSNGHRTRPWPIDRAVREGYERVVWVFKAVEAISGSASRLPFRLKQGGQPLTDHPLYQVLNKRANPLETGRQFRKRLIAQVLLSKNGAFVEITRSRAGDIVRMDLLPPGRTRPIPGLGDVLIDHYEVFRFDGSRQDIPAENVRWFREPHPIDPYMGTTPLESAGMSVEVDFFARLYNAAFLRNDARPGGVLAIDGEMDPAEMDRIEDRFGRGPIDAGRLSVINGAVSYIDLAARPRDMQHKDTATISKNEILAAFGVPESVLGYSADRTYANAEQEHLNFWSITMPPILDLLLTGFDEDSGDDLVGEFDTSSIEVLQRVEATKRDEARTEFNDGLITIDEYRKRAGYPEIARPETRSLFMVVGKEPIPTSDADAKKMAQAEPERVPQLGEFPQTAPGMPGHRVPPHFGPSPKTPPGGQSAPQSPSPPASPPPPGAPGESRRAAFFGASKALRVIDGGGGPETPPENPPAEVAADGQAAPSGRRVMRLIRPREAKAAVGAESDADQAAHDRLERELAAVLTNVTRRMVGRTVARLESPKGRKGTRHWSPDPRYPADLRIGTKAVDGNRAVDEQRWQDEAVRAARPLVSAAALAAALALIDDLGGDRQELASAVAAGADAATADVLRLIGASALGQAGKVAAAINAADQSGQPMDQIVVEVEGSGAALGTWAALIAAQAATATIAGGRDAGARAMADEHPLDGISRVWRTRHDGKVRESHRHADGQRQPVGAPFVVGSALLRYPGDPLGPPGEVAGCRCVLDYQSNSLGRYVPRPAAEAALAAAR